MKKVTVNVLVEIASDGKTNTYKSSNGAQFTGMVMESDISNLIRLSGNQIISEGIQESIIAFNKTGVIAQDAYVGNEE